MRSASSKICARPEAATQVRDWKRQRLRVVFTNGCFDLLHPGHVRYLEKARALGDRLVVGINDDRSLRSLKGRGRPLQPLQDRAELLGALAAVDLVVPFPEADPLELVRALEPDVLAKGADWPLDRIVGREVVEARGGKVMQIELEQGYSTTALIESIRRSFCPPR